MRIMRRFSPMSEIGSTRLEELSVAVEPERSFAETDGMRNVMLAVMLAGAGFVGTANAQEQKPFDTSADLVNRLNAHCEQARQKETKVLFADLDNREFMIRESATLVLKERLTANQKYALWFSPENQMLLDQALSHKSLEVQKRAEAIQRAAVKARALPSMARNAQEQVRVGITIADNIAKHKLLLAQDRTAKAINRTVKTVDKAQQWLAGKISGLF